ncbi:MAG: hypothetical protein GX663_09645 [Clostridiales bacterium]|nr:hypothetical protein [Clostridiales bacterium]
MSVTIDLKALVLIVVGIALVVFIIYLIQVMRKLLVTVTHTNKILEDMEVVSEIAAKRSQDVDGIIGNVSETVESMAEAVKGKQNVFAAVVSIIKSLAIVKNLVSDDKNKEK